MTPAELSRTVLRSVRSAVEERELSVPVPARIVVQPPPRPGCGDYASNIALQLAGPAGRPAREIAEILRKRLAGSAGIARVEIAGPGFLNFTLGDGARAALVRDVLAQGPAYGSPQGSQASSGDVPAGLSGARGVVVAEVLGRLTRPDAAEEAPDPAQESGRAELAELVTRLGADEARWALLRPAAHDPVRLPERPVQRESNPRFRVQYAYARTQALLRNAQDLGFTSEPGDVLGAGAAGTAHVRADGGAARPEAWPDGGAPRPDGGAPRPDGLQSLHSLLATYPRTVEAAARHRAPDRLVRHLEATADAYFRWQDGCPPLPVGERKPLAVHRARLALAEATGTVLANGLRLLGVSAPEHL